jgi:hypothetical protein
MVDSRLENTIVVRFVIDVIESHLGHKGTSFRFQLDLFTSNRFHLKSFNNDTSHLPRCPACPQAKSGTFGDLCEQYSQQPKSMTTSIN